MKKINEKGGKQHKSMLAVEDGITQSVIRNASHVCKKQKNSSRGFSIYSSFSTPVTIRELQRKLHSYLLMPQNNTIH